MSRAGGLDLFEGGEARAAAQVGVEGGDVAVVEAGEPVRKALARGGAVVGDEVGVAGAHAAFKGGEHVVHLAQQVDGDDALARGGQIPENPHLSKYTPNFLLLLRHMFLKRSLVLPFL